MKSISSKTTQMVARETESCYGWRYLFKNKLNKKAAKGGMLVLLGRFYEVDVKQHTVSYAWNESCYEGRFVYENKLSKMMTCLMTCSLMILNRMKATIISMDMMLRWICFRIELWHFSLVVYWCFPTDNLHFISFVHVKFMFFLLLC